MSANNKTSLTLNVDFKNKLIKLKATLSRAFDIQLPIDKLVHDTVYRLNVFDELLSLGHEQVTAQVKSLQQTAVYIDIQPVSGNVSKQDATVERNKQRIKHAIAIKEHTLNKSSFVILLLASIIFIFIVLLQTNILQVTVLSGPVSTQHSSPNILDSLLAEAAPAVHLAPTIQLPVDNAKLTMRLHGSNTIGEHLAPALLTAYLKTLGVSEMRWIKGDSEVDRQLQYIHNNQAYEIELQAHGSSTAFKDLANGVADLAISSRKIKDDEVALLKAQYGNLGLAGSEVIISLDGVAIIVNKKNSLNSLTLLQLADIFSGEINNWEQLGGEDLSINVYARDLNSGTWDSFKSIVFSEGDSILSSNASRYQSSSKLSDLIAQDQAGIGFIGLPYINNSKALSIAASITSPPIYPTQFTVSTEDYPLSRRLNLYVPAASSEFIERFTHFVTSAAGQKIVEQVGLVSQNIQLQGIYPNKKAPQIYNDYGEIAQRLSLNFRFQQDSNQLDSKGKDDLLRVVEYIRQHAGLRVVLMGFSDLSEEQDKQSLLSLKRAQIVERELQTRGLNITAVEGFGSQLPIASTKTAIGRSKNRRVEVWVF
ncbi:substrate-binding domain-containing protein [Psychromonas sp. SR45-3]|uniref:substrate-binding domain-containing protein n=1 Tax=Psychromonas sp. SR45-3 TaxID=2760930 RepID=UPI0015F977E1|nr:phosphate ABC transporter substrate-binding/OmpA family protein [Psychromonas sp. SR45-3]MBB1271936.1 substrate-binding domain-containing protein [Psychromonas sp. SR45-3]